MDSTFIGFHTTRSGRPPTAAFLCRLLWSLLCWRLYCWALTKLKDTWVLAEDAVLRLGVVSARVRRSVCRAFQARMHTGHWSFGFWGLSVLSHSVCVLQGPPIPWQAVRISEECGLWSKAKQALCLCCFMAGWLSGSLASLNFTFFICWPGHLELSSRYPSAGKLVFAL